MTSNKKRVDYRLRLQAYENTVDGILLKYLASLGSRPANSLIFQHLRMALLPLAYQDLGELSPEQLRIKALQAASALEEYASSIRQMFNAEKQQMVVMMEPKGYDKANDKANSKPNDKASSKANRHQQKSTLTALFESSSNAKTNEHQEESLESSESDESDESDEWEGPKVSAETIAFIDKLMGGDD